MDWPHQQQLEGLYSGGGAYDRDPKRGYERTYEQPQMGSRNDRYSLESPYGRPSDITYGNQPEPTYAAREPTYTASRGSAAYGSRHEPAYSRPNEDPYRGSQREGTYSPYEQPQPSPQGPPYDYRTEVNTSRSGRLTATFKAEPIPVGEGLKLNPGYFKTCAGILKILQIVSTLCW
ncbi:hypothetical protein BIW11_02278 [Tropilaelaps mercedesae]|uniref:Uncharacterized protein n=1 Tax=Tropilaelaps mercedesae TaxID=418985 RepID=A0A1V9X023_9ACAR|nr:hypothetical protein BIW11_02278 [Tropilaelaps mercedesae]